MHERPATAPDRRAIAWLIIATASAVHLAALASALSGSEFGAAWFYDLAWWPYIFAVDAIVYLRCGRSLLFTRPRAFVLLALWSAAFWLAFEVANFRLQNWYYVGIPPDWVARGPGVLLSFATVLPGIFETAELLACLRIGKNTRTPPFELRAGLSRALSVLGVLFLVLPLVFPRHAYPLIWGALVLLAEPWLAARGERGLLSLLARGQPATILRLLLAGVVCGFLWESWNHLSLARWIYTVPFFEQSKLFEMPFLGFLGFPPFALECFTFARLLVALRLMPEWELGVETLPVATSSRASRREITGALAALAFSVPAIVGVNVWTLRATAPRISEIADVPPSIVERFEGAGIRSAEELLTRAREGSLAPLVADVDPVRVTSWMEAADLMQVKGLGARGLRWLALAGIESVAELARADADALAQRFSSDSSGPLPLPTPAELRVWVAGARAVSR